METIDIKKKLNEIEINVEEDKNLPKFDDIAINAEPEDFDDNFEYVLDIKDEEMDINLYETPIQGHGIKKVFKVIIRKLIAFLIVPLSMKQTRFNTKLYNYLKVQEKRKGLKNDSPKNVEVNKNEKYINEEYIDSLENRITKLEMKLSELEKKQ